MKFKTAINDKGKQTTNVKAKGKSDSKAKKKNPLTETSNRVCQLPMVGS